ncbi:quinone oxidoreductase family protein [Curvivirga sp.]|uniref:quinone oxidoreductase family protein n=1 Tax=Curvivirga sp. TaxID=2856848 RepID=UPI003B594DAA
MAYAYTITKTGNPDVIQKKSIERPVPNNDQVLIENHATAVNFIDTIIRRGDMPESMMPTLPHVPGVEGAGKAIAIGDNITNVTKDDHVAWMGPIGAGGYGKFTIIDKHYLTKIPKNLTFEQAASLPVNAITAWHMMVNLGQVKKGQKILVHAAAGGVGTMILHIAKYLGLETIASVSTDKIDYAKQQGATHAVDYKTENLAGRVNEITKGKGVNLTLNPVAGDSIKSDLEMLAPLGTAVVFGFLSGPPTGTFESDLTQYFNKSIAIRVSDIYTYFFNCPEEFQKDMTTVFQLLKDGILRPNIQTLPIEDVAEAHRMLEAGEVKGKLVLNLS